ncbi:MAG TPA: hypothetical protein DIV41_08365 [Ruminococcaceae bacterium]|jgi:formate-dependent nitrite reductase membrane component NrfD|nr:hypothetical protein [Oscillospiraceae bacterium]
MDKKLERINGINLITDIIIFVFISVFNLNPAQSEYNTTALLFGLVIVKDAVWGMILFFKIRNRLLEKITLAVLYTVQLCTFAYGIITKSHSPFYLCAVTSAIIWYRDAMLSGWTFHTVKADAFKRHGR